MSDDNTTPPSTTLPSSTVAFNAALDAEIMKREPPDALTQAAPWFQRRLATLMSTVKNWIK